MSDKQTEDISQNPEEGSDRRPDVVYKRRPDAIVHHNREDQIVSFQSENGIELRITIHTPDIFQLKYVVEGDQPIDFSYAIDPDFNPQETDFSLQETDTHLALSTDSLSCLVSKENMKVEFLNNEGETLCQDAKPYFRRDTLMKGIQEVKVTHQAPDQTEYFGLGDKARKSQLRGGHFENWNTDAYAFERGDDPLYRSIPFYYALNGDGCAYGIFMDNPYRSHFDFDSKANNTTSFWAEGGCMNYYFINGPELTSVSERYMQLTGTPELPPLWGLGYHQCRWSYYPDETVRELAHNFRDKNIPCDAIYLDIDYMDDYRVFTWNKEHFPDPRKLVSDLRENGFETIVMIDPGIKVDNDYDVYCDGLEKDHFCKRPDGELMIGPVWPTRTVFPDYTSDDTRKWWGDLYEDLINNKGIYGYWNDMNEPAVFEVDQKTFPDNILHHYEGHLSSHKKAHNIYGMQMARASYEGIKKHNPKKRPFLLTRANFSGGQRYAALWTGDNIADWDHLRLANEQCRRLSISGYSFVGTDIGGFVKNPSAELFTRWLQLSIFHPLFRNHSMGYNVDGASAVKEEAVEIQKKISDSHQEPWTFGEKHTDINRSVIELRYKLLHYLYTAFWKYVENGTPILRPLSFDYQQDRDAVLRNDEFMFGDNILVSPVLDEGAESVETFFPEGEWYDFRTNEVFVGPQTHIIDAPIEEIPFFVKAGTVLPLREVMQHIGEREQSILKLNIYHGGQETGSQFYEDSGEGYGYESGSYRKTTFLTKPVEEGLKITAIREGDYIPEYNTVQLRLIGLPFKPSAILVDGKEIEYTIDTKEKADVYLVDVEPGFEKIEVRE